MKGRCVRNRGGGGGEVKRERRRREHGDGGRRGKHSRIMPRCEMHGSPRIITNARDTSAEGAVRRGGRENPGTGIIAGAKRARPRRT